VSHAGIGAVSAVPLYIVIVDGQFISGVAGASVVAAAVVAASVVAAAVVSAAAVVAAVVAAAVVAAAVVAAVVCVCVDEPPHEDSTTMKTNNSGKTLRSLYINEIPPQTEFVFVTSVKSRYKR
jgi:hypothetical protein